ncbi:acyl-CoA dehydrogenase family protein [Mycobacterium colombiense]|nr:acyl-CoA dehydrogenase family protein [Mycobacterium colombiense]
MSPKARDYHQRLTAFMTEFVFPAEESYLQYRQKAGQDDHTVPPIVEKLKALAKERGLWNLFLPAVSGLSNLEYAPLAELTGWSLDIAPEATNCAAPDTGNMETLHLFATEEQRRQWLDPLLAGEIRSGFSMTEPAVASSDARNIETSIVRDGADYLINGRKWWTTGASDPRCKVLIVMGRTDPDAATHRQQSMVLVPVCTPGVTILRSTPVFGWQDQHGHCEIVFDNARVPATNLLGEEGAGFAIAQARLGPGRIHHCMRALGAAERALALMVDRAQKRAAFGRPLAEQGVVREQIARSRNEIDQARLLCEKAAWTIDQHGNKAAHLLVSQIKAIAPRVACDVIDRAIRVHGAAGVSDDFPLARLYSWHRAMRVFDGPDEVHMRTIARSEIGRAKNALASAVTQQAQVPSR